MDMDHFAFDAKVANDLLEPTSGFLQDILCQLRPLAAGRLSQEANLRLLIGPAFGFS